MVSNIQSISDNGLSRAFMNLQQKQQQVVQVHDISSTLSSLAKVASNLS
jgi:hypothetical protein